MNEMAVIAAESLPSLLDRASAALAGAKTSAEVLEARDTARVAYDAAKSAGRMARAKQAHDDVIGAVYRAQADALLIEARAKMRLADEYDAAQERGEVADGRDGPGAGVAGYNAKATAADLGLRRDEIHEARKLRDAEAANPGATAAALHGMVARGEEPTKAKLRRELAPEQEAHPDPHATERRKLAGLTREALEDDVIGLRAALEDERAKRKRAEEENRRLKDEVRDLAADDKNEVIRRLQREAKHNASERWRQQEETRRAMAQVHALKKRVAELEKMGIEL